MPLGSIYDKFGPYQAQLVSQATKPISIANIKKYFKFVQSYEIYLKKIIHF
ncbi:Uncharacterised protein [Sphingobacterium spiritivorum]|uniref:Uncharacterized protein n=1 Tax=Sphingobacterium spiritivorum ATCC 33861 TaxID=525373 RepID=D7VKD1_SPHSI|nr:hypothetical protein HMPREF0766_11450 [Sphingobacterium spiritivorum ATCC 33861]SUI99699.1 Uncharacterised protein [Sphingobacterium spiritivorum]